MSGFRWSERLNLREHGLETQKYIRIYMEENSTEKEANWECDEEEKRQIRRRA
jgi:hypothetical protein